VAAEQKKGLLGRLFGGEAGASEGAVSRIRHVMSHQEMFMVYQPVVDLNNGEVFAYEALLRSRSPYFDSPVAMFAAAVESNCVGELGRTVRKMSIESCTDFPLFLNIHPNELNEHYLVQPDDPIFWHDKGVHVEITESVPLSHFELCQSVIKEVRGKGVALAIDDLGAGYSNLKYIADLSPEVVKLDRNLISDVTRGGRHFQLVKAITELCNAMDASVVAEGIETRDELLAVQDCGAHYGQGYFLARPAFPPPLVNWPERHRRSTKTPPAAESGPDATN
jgi:EAL domain-containing protein (putative c-di-GMP-specific phosphodiesterase class I)